MKFNINQEEFVNELEKLIEGQAGDEIIKKWIVNHTDETEVNDRQIEAIKQNIKDTSHPQSIEKCERVLTWFKTQPFLPQPDREIIFKFLWAAKYDEELCKKVMVNYYTLRGTDDDIFGHRDPCTPEAKHLQEISHFICLPGFTDELYRVTFSAMIDHDPEKFHPKDWIKRVLNMADLRVRDDFCFGDVIIYDLKGFGMQHLMKFPITLAKKLVIATERALPSKIKQVHMINCPTFIDKIISLFKPFMKEKLASRIYVHNDSLDELFNFVPKRMIPNEYGGNAGSLTELSKIWRDELENNREWFLDQERTIKGIFLEAKKAGKLFVDSGDMFGIEGSFKKLDID